MRDRVIGITVMVLSVISLIFSSYSGSKWYTYTKCQAKTNDALIQSSNARSQASDVDREALDEMVTSVLAIKPGEGGAKVRQALQDYVDKRAKADAQRAANPLPEPHTCS